MNEHIKTTQREREKCIKHTSSPTQVGSYGRNDAKNVIKDVKYLLNHVETLTRSEQLRRDEGFLSSSYFYYLLLPVVKLNYYNI